MSEAGTFIGIRAARCTVEDKSDFLQVLRKIAEECNTHIICFNADVLAGRRHAESAVLHAIRSFESGVPISNTLEMEGLLYAAGSRQCNATSSFGIKAGENHLWICCNPPGKKVWVALSQIVCFQEGDAWDTVDPKKRDLLIRLYGIGAEELNTLDGPDCISDLVLERVALLHVLR